MQSAATRFFFFWVMTLAISSSRPSSAQQPVAAKQMEEDLMQVRLKYLPEFCKVLTGRETAGFYQIDWRLDLMINLQLAQAPVLNP